MTSNRDWLFSLPLDEQIAWMNAEHQDGTLDGDTEPESSNTDAVSERYATAFKWLDRLGYGKGGVIDNSLYDTPEQGEVVMPLDNWREHLDTEKQNGDSRDKIEADVRDTVPEWHVDKVVGWLDRQAAITEREVLCHPDERDEQIAEIQVEVDELKERADYSSHGWAKANIGWAEANAEAEKWRMKCDEYRSLFGKCIDYADAIHALMDEIDEGWS